MKNSSQFPKPVQEVVKAVNAWLADNTPEYDCDPVVLTDYDFSPPAKRKITGYILCSNYEDGFSALIYKDGQWYTRGSMSEREDQPFTGSHPEHVIIGIMAG